MKKVLVILFAIALCLAAFAFYLFYAPGKVQKQLQEAYQSYSEGEQAKTVAQRKDAFNHALTLYNQLEETYHPRFGNGKIYYNLGNSYFQLGEYPLALYYYYRSLALMPTNDLVKQNIAITASKLSLPPASQESVFNKIFFFHSYLSLPDRLRAFFWFSAAVLLFFSASIWLPSRLWKILGTLSGICSLVFLCSILYTRFFSPIEAVTIKSTLLYRDAGTEYAHVKEEPLSAGYKVTVLEILKEGTWLKILSPEGNLGYVPQNNMRVI